MKLYLILIISLSTLSSCAHNFKNYTKWKDNPATQQTFQVSKDLVVTGYYKDNHEYVMRQFIPDLFNISNNASYEIVKIDIHSQTAAGGQCFTGYLGWAALYLVSLGIIPIGYSFYVDAEITIKNLQTNQLKTVHFDADHTQGSGWLYWIRAWTKDDWYFTKDIPRRYSASKNLYFHDSFNWAIEESN